MKYITPPKIQQLPLRKTRHTRAGLPDLTLVGTHLYEVTATASDSQVTTLVVAADGDLEARAGFMAVQTACRSIHEVTFAIRQLDKIEEAFA